MCDEDELIIDVPTQFSELEEEGKDEMILILAKDEALILVDILVPILQKRTKDVVMDN